MSKSRRWMVWAAVLGLLASAGLATPSRAETGQVQVLFTKAGLVVGVNAGAGLLAQLTGALALKIFIVGFIACTVPPFIVWAIGFHFFKINPAVLMGGVAGARSHSGPCREAAVEIKSTVPWIGFPVAYAVSGILLTVFGYFAMLLAQ